MHPERAAAEHDVGVATGMYYTPAGGDIMFVEAAIRRMYGSGPQLSDGETKTQVSGWGNVSLILTGQPGLKPYTVAVYGFVGEYGEVQWHLVSAVAVASVVPLLLLFVVFQRALVSGLTGGAIKT